MCILSLTRPSKCQNNITFGNVHWNEICPLFKIGEVHYGTILICLRISSTLLYPLFRYQCESLQFLKQSKGNEREKINGCFTRRAHCVKTCDNYEIGVLWDYGGYIHWKAADWVTWLCHDLIYLRKSHSYITQNN